MVFYEIERIKDLLCGHRVIIYYIDNITQKTSKLYKSVDSALEMLEKKNDDLIIFKVSQNTQQFSQFKELYKPEICSPIALFVVNSEGIPLICEEINREEDIYQTFESICTNCKLNFVSIDEIKTMGSENETICQESITEVLKNGLNHRSSHQIPKMTCDKDENSASGSTNINEGNQSTSTVLQIRLPDGTKDKQKFDQGAFLQEVHDFISTKFNLNDFDLKTYNRNAFSANDYEKTLQDLDLTPTGVVIVVNKNVVSFNGSSNISKTIQYGFWIVFGKLTPIFRYFQGLLFAFWSSFFPSGNNNSRQIQNQPERGKSNAINNGSTGTKKSSSRFGNIHTLRRSEDSDDENNRYNGNSTQQK